MAKFKADATILSLMIQTSTLKLIVIAIATYCDSVRKTGIVFVFVKFYSSLSRGNVATLNQEP